MSVEQEVLDAINRMFASMHISQPRFAYWQVGRKAYCWNTEPLSDKKPWHFFVYRIKGPKGKQSWEMVKDIGFTKRRTAKAHAKRAKEQSERQLKTRPFRE